MERIDALTQIMQVLKRKLSDPQTENTRATKKPSLPETTNSESVSISNASVQQLETRIAERVKSINRSDSQWYSKAGRVFVDSVLAWEFGDQLVQDARFSEMSQKVLQVLNGDQSIQNKLHQLLDQFASK